MNRRVLIAGGLLVIPLLLFLGVGLGKDPNAVRTPMVGREAPLFNLVIVDSEETIRLDQLRGTPVVLNFWATWCVPCYAEHQVLLEAAARRPDVRFIGVVYQDEPVNVRRFVAQHGGGYPNVMDPGGTTAIAYGVYGVPETFFIDGAGTIRAKHEGPLDRTSMAERLAQLGGRS